MSDFYKNLHVDVDFDIPEYLGDIEFLREHPLILKRIIELSESKSLKPFIDSRRADFDRGGMSWRMTPEGYEYWESIIGKRDTDRFYELL